MSLVLDGSVTLAWYFEDESTRETNDVLMQVARRGAVVPSLWRLEVANGFSVGLRRGRISEKYRKESLERLAFMNIVIDHDTDTYAWSTTLHLADRLRLTLYDAAYLELAQRRDLPLATLDKDLRRAAGKLGVTLMGR